MTNSSHFNNINISNPSSRFLRLETDAVARLDTPISLDETKQAVWSCGSDKAPGPDGFNFCLVKKYWDVFQGDVCAFVYEFFAKSFLPAGCNSSFITLIPKVSNLMGVGDYRPISLIGV